MITFFSIILNEGKIEFSIRGVANIINRTAKFQALCNGGVFAESKNYEKVRTKLMNAVNLNQTIKEESH